jgi:hypothetical protein
VIDEPSVFDYGRNIRARAVSRSTKAPRSSVRPGGRATRWSRANRAANSGGRKLVKTPAGYVAQNQLIACLAMLTVDVRVSPRGDLARGLPQRRTRLGHGTAGRGEDFQHRAHREGSAATVLAWSASPTELRVAFDRDLDVTKLKTSRSKPARARPVRLRGRSLRVVPARLSGRHGSNGTPRFDVPVLGAALARIAHTLVFTTAPRTPR